MPRVVDLTKLDFTPNQAKHLGGISNGVEGNFNALSATGNNSQTNAYQLVAHVNQFTTATSTNNSVKLPKAESEPYGHYLVSNFGANQIYLFPASGDSINNLATDASILIPINSCASIIKQSDTSWWVLIASATGTVSGLYTPTLTNVANLSANTPYECQYLRVGNVVTVSGAFDADAVAAAVATSLRMTLPITSNFSTSLQCGGVANSTSTAGVISADSANDQALISWVAGGTANTNYRFTFTYYII